VSPSLTGSRAAASLRARGSPLAEPACQRARLDALDLPAFESRLPGGVLRAASPAILQVNVGRLCNMSCAHCHVDAGPDRTEVMPSSTVDAVIAWMRTFGASTLDLTGGAPELHPRFRDLVDAGRDAGMHVIDRCNLSVLLLARSADLPEWLAERGVEIVASLPHWRRSATDAQRGDGAFERSLMALRRLNDAGYGRGDPSRRLTLMHNPAGAWLPADQASLEREWRQGLQREHGLSFDRLIALTNMPISRYLDWLEARGETAAYMDLLVRSFNVGAVSGLMCRDTVSVSWDGRIFDCDFNQMLDLPSHGASLGAPTTSLTGRRIRTGPHCYGCTAGAGSSCGGATAASAT
jgi:radical SAM/Cys-rich protein